MANDINGKTAKDELLDERQLDNVVGGFNFSTQINGEGLERIRQQFNKAIFSNGIQNNAQRPA